MLKHVQCVAEFLPKDGCEQELFDQLKQVGVKSLKNEEGCLRYLVTKQLPHAVSPQMSKYTVVTIEEFVDMQAFDKHCSSSYFKDFFQKYVESKVTGLVEDVNVRLFS